MECLSDQVLARACLARNQYAAIMRRHPADAELQSNQLWRIQDERIAFKVGAEQVAEVDDALAETVAPGVPRRFCHVDDRATFGHFREYVCDGAVSRQFAPMPHTLMSRTPILDPLRR